MKNINTAFLDLFIAMFAVCFITCLLVFGFCGFIVWGIFKRRSRTVKKEVARATSSNMFYDDTAAPSFLKIGAGK